MEWTLFPFAILGSGFSFPVTFRAWTYRIILVYRFLLFLYVYSALPLVPVSDFGFYLGSSLLCTGCGSVCNALEASFRTYLGT
jgi:hypothetical protein